MNLLFLLLVLNTVTIGFLQTCLDFQVQSVIHNGKRLSYFYISIIFDLSLEVCALECLLVRTCKSFNYVGTDQGMLCEINSVNRTEVDEINFNNRSYSVYVDIQDWPQELAKTCASRPCADNQRCIPTNPYRCMVIDCGPPPVIPHLGADVNMFPLTMESSLGSKANYKCRDQHKTVHIDSFHAILSSARICSSDSTWSQNPLYCL